MSTLGLKRPDEASALRATMQQCAGELEAALALKVGVMDSESKALAIAQIRIEAMHAVVERLRSA